MSERQGPTVTATHWTRLHWLLRKKPGNSLGTGLSGRDWPFTHDETLSNRACDRRQLRTESAH